VYSDRSRTARLLLINNAIIDIKNTDGMSPFYLSAICDSSGVLQILLANGADPNAKDKDGNLLHVAVIHDSPKVAQLLLAHNMNINEISNNKLTPLHLAVCHNNLSCIQLLLAHKANVDVKDNNDRTPLDLAEFLGFGNCISLLRPN